MLLLLARALRRQPFFPASQWCWASAMGRYRWPGRQRHSKGSSRLLPRQRLLSAACSRGLGLQIGLQR